MTSQIGIFDKNFSQNNPLTQKVYSNEYKELFNKWTSLPTYKEAHQILKIINDNNVSLFQSGTGSGKTVIIPKLLLHYFNYNKKILVVVPKQILAKNNAIYSAKTLDVQLENQLENQVGYRYKGENKSNDNTKLLYVTDGVIVNMLKNDNLLSNYSGVILDEAHERRVQTDVLLYLLRNVCVARQDFKFIIMSATIETQIFKNYYSNLKYSDMTITGEPLKKVETIYFKNKLIKKDDYMSKGLEIIEKILQEKTTGDILFFVPSINDTKKTCSKILESDNKICIEVYANMNKEKEVIAIQKNSSQSKRKIIVATNVAESSLTIEGIKYVIDSGYENIAWFDPENNCYVMEKQFISKAQAKQRLGRTGRTEEGICYRLYTEEQYNNFLDFPKPIILSSNIYSECLNLASFDDVKILDDVVAKLKEIFNNFISPPKNNYFRNAIKLLYKLNLIKENKLTELGLKISQIPYEPSDAIALFTGYKLNCEKEVLLIISALQIIKNKISGLFTKKIQDMQKIFLNLAKYNSDHITILKIMEKFISLYKEDMPSIINLDAIIDNDVEEIDDIEDIEDIDDITDEEIVKNVEEYVEFDEIKDINLFLNKYNLNRDILIKIKKNYDILMKSLNFGETIQKYEKLNDFKLEDRIIVCFMNGYKYNL